MRLPFSRRKKQHGATANAEKPRSAVGAPRQSRAFSAAIDSLRSRDRRRVLDFGAAYGENVEFFSKVGCQLEILDLYPQLVERPDRLKRTNDSHAVGQLIAGILDQRPGKAETRSIFDLLLTWDLFDFLSTEQIRGLVEGVQPYAASGTRLLCQISYLGTLPEQPRQIKIQDQETLIATANPGTRPSPRYTEPQLLKVMSGWEVDRCFLQRDGFREYVFIRR